MRHHTLWPRRPLSLGDMKIPLFAFTSFLAILLMASARVVSTGRIDHHFGVLGSIVKTIPSSAVSALLTSLTFWLASLFLRSRHPTRFYAWIGALTGLTSYGLAWALADDLRALGVLAIFLPFMACAVTASVLSRARDG